MLNIKVVGADFSSNSIGRSYWLTSNRDGLVGEYSLGVNFALSKVNGANPALPLVSYGAPTYDTNFANLGAANWLDTRLVATPEMTMIAVSTTPGNSTMIGNYSGSNSQNVDVVYTGGSGSISYQAGSSQSPPTIADGAGFPLSNLIFQTLATRSTGTTAFTAKFDSYFQNTKRSSTRSIPANSRSIFLQEAIALGSSRGNTSIFSTPNKMASALIYNRALSDVELDAVVLQLRAAMLLRGLAS